MTLDIGPGLHGDIPNEVYHAGPGVSRSDLWTIYTKTPAHYRFGEKKESKALDFGTASDMAILDPELFEERVMMGPEDRRGNRWKDAEASAISLGKLLLTGPDYEACLQMRDVVHANAYLHRLITQGQPLAGQSGYWRDAETGKFCKFRPDLIRKDLGVMLDLKTTRSAAARTFASSVLEYGYHAQEAWYSAGYEACGLGSLNGFVFLAMEKEAPFAFRLYELPPSIVAEGHLAMRSALALYAQCEETDEWPGYDEAVTELPIPRWGYKLTPAPDGEDDGE